MPALSVTASIYGVPQTQSSLIGDSRRAADDTSVRPVPPGPSGIPVSPAGAAPSVIALAPASASDRGTNFLDQANTRKNNPAATGQTATQSTAADTAQTKSFLASLQAEVQTPAAPLAAQASYQFPTFFLAQQIGQDHTGAGAESQALGLRKGIGAYAVANATNASSANGYRVGDIIDIAGGTGSAPAPSTNIDLAA
ncbi:MAG: hypothetical protein HQL37_12250 [Alphaproteobacteria bacterium]|nr:hypothetical protein [Alphaproteobacteria bacterium]